MKTFLKRLQPPNRVAVQLASVSFIAVAAAYLSLITTGEETFKYIGVGLFIIGFIVNSITFLVVFLNYVLGFVSHKEALFTLYVIVLSVSISLFLLFI